MKRLLLSFIFLTLFSFIHAQNSQPKKFTLLGESFSKELKFEVNPVGTEEIVVNIFPENGKDYNDNQKITQNFTVHRGKQTLKVDLSNLPDGSYSFDIVQRVYVQQLNRRVTRCVYSENFRKD